MALIWISVAGGIGACIRWYFSILAAKIQASYAILALAFINILGSFVIGICATLVPHYISPTMGTLCSTGFCGGLTSFSTLQLDSVKLVEQGKSILGLINLIANPAASWFFCFLGTLIGVTLFH